MKTELPTLTIANAGTTSGELGERYLRTLTSLLISGPAALTGTATVEVITKRGSGTWVTLQSAGSDVTIPAAKGTVIHPVCFIRMRIKSSAAEGAERNFELVGSND